MNIFVINSNPILSAMDLCDAHVCKMVVESCQLLSTQDYMCGLTEGRYKPTHVNHPCRKCLDNPYNYLWLVFHLSALLGEYEVRFNRTHMCQDIFVRNWFKKLSSLHEYGLKEAADIPSRTTFPKCMPEEFKTGRDTLIDVVASYKNYYRYKKQTLKRWKYTNRGEPVWLK